jgi:DNA-binding transcriptional ArsR family regulator
MTEPNILTGCSVLPPMNPTRPRPTSTYGKSDPPKRTKQTAERFGAINAFVDFTLASLTRNEIAVWLILWRDTKQNGLAKTSQADLARRGGISDRTARRTIARLRRMGLLTVVRRGGLRQGVSVYRVHPLKREPP